MKKLLAPLVLLMALAVGSLGHAQSDGFGIYSGYPEWLGIQYQSNSLRLGGGLTFAGLGGSADLMLGKSVLVDQPGTALSWYYGAGVSAGFYLFYSVRGFDIFPHGLAGIEYQLPGQTFKVYGEAQLGPRIYLGDYASVYGGFGFGFNTRFGLIFGM